MNRREALKSVGAAAAASVTGPLRKYLPAEVPWNRHVAITFRGPSILHFPLDGHSGTLHFTAFPYESVCPQPVHLPRLLIDRTKVRCTSSGQELVDSWLLAGLSVRPLLAGGFAAPGFNESPLATIGQPIVKPANGDWTSLKWIPRLDVDVDPRKLSKATTCSVLLNAGTLNAMEPYHVAARRALWFWTTPAGWKEAEAALGKAPQSAMTDQLQIVGEHTSQQLTLRVSPLAVPSESFDLTFEALGADDSIDLEIVAEPPADGHYAETRPLKLYCAYYGIATQEIAAADRILPYLSPVDIGGRAIEEADHISHLIQPTPRPLCGSMKVVF